MKRGDEGKDWFFCEAKTSRWCQTALYNTIWCNVGCQSHQMLPVTIHSITVATGGGNRTHFRLVSPQSRCNCCIGGATNGLKSAAECYIPHLKHKLLKELADKTREVWQPSLSGQDGKPQALVVRVVWKWADSSTHKTWVRHKSPQAKTHANLRVDCLWFRCTTCNDNRSLDDKEESV